MIAPRLHIDDIARMTAFAAEAPRPLALLEAIGQLTQRVLVAKGITMFRYLHETAEVERIHSSDLVAYPVGGRKRIADFPVNQSAIAGGEVYIARGPDEIRTTYRDAETIFALGVTSIMNVPARQYGRNVGAMNILGDEGQFTTADVADARILAGLMLPALLTWTRPGGSP